MYSQHRLVDILDKRILAKFSDLTYNINESKTTNSFYLTINLNGLHRGIRFSDHPSSNKKIKHHFSLKRCNDETIFNSLLAIIQSMRHQYVLEFLGVGMRKVI